MSTMRPGFVDSEYFEITDTGWGLKDGAPEDVKQEFEEYMEYERKLEEMGVDA